jgi:hypothetical protein
MRQYMSNLMYECLHPFETRRTQRHVCIRHICAVEEHPLLSERLWMESQMSMHKYMHMHVNIYVYVYTYIMHTRLRT